MIQCLASSDYMIRKLGIYSIAPVLPNVPFAPEKGLSKGVASHQGLKWIQLFLDLHSLVASPEGWPIVRVASQKGLHCIGVDDT